MPHRSLPFVLCSLLLLIVTSPVCAQSGFYLTGSGTFSLGFIYNHGVGITSTKNAGPAIGKGFRSEIGLGRSFHNDMLKVEFGVGTYSMTNPIELSMIGLKAGKNDLGFTHRYYSASLRAGYRIATPLKNLSVELVAGSTFLFHRSPTYFVGPWVYPEPAAWYNPDDLLVGRYKIEESDNTHKAFLFHAGLRLAYPLTKRLNLTSMIYYEQAFTAIRAVLYSTERDYEHNEDLHYKMLSVFSGDALGLQAGLRYALNR